ncbi:cupin domain-containing protein [Salinarimonas ramus]|uniref:Cupin type-2 domain-containing protein n=1 Tax=Salinarimonas ramus TaxID=690164 RepID=A0A917Q480_9HYPH|nr:cupin domain-containing protein [Salinarimonas ramus]GGK21004.1 hypothetical protein GCM10011322_04550 [Salinarimonas ramus]
MSPDEFDRLRRAEGWGEPRRVRFEASSRSPPHVHDQASFVYVLDGAFVLNTSDGATRYRPGETCMLDAHVEHAEEAGPDGATILVARK